MLLIPFPPPPTGVFCPLLKRSSGNPYLKILEFLKLFVDDAPMKKNPNICLLPLRALFVIGR